MSDSLLKARSVAGLVDVSLRLLLRRPALLGGLALRSSGPVAVFLLAGLGLIHARPDWAGSGVLPILAGAAAWFLIRRGVTVGAVALAVQDLASEEPVRPAAAYLAQARAMSHRLLPSAAGGAVLLALAPLFAGLTPLVAPTWLLAAGPLAATGQDTGGKARWAQGGRSIHLLILLTLGWLWMAINLAVGPMIAVYLAERLLAVDLTWWGRLVRPTHALWLELSVIGGWVVMEPLAQVAAAAFALDLRVRREGLDLKRLVAAAAAVGALLVATPALHAAPSQESVADAMERVYARPEFAHAPEGPAAETLTDLLERFWKWLESLFDVEPRTHQEPGCGGGLPGEGQAAGLGNLLALLAAFLALVLLGLALARLIEARRAAETAEEEEAGPQAPEALTRTPGQWLADADRLADEGRLAEALRHALLALLGALHRERAIDYDEARTNGDYLVDLRRRRPGAAAPYRELVGLFDRAWYGAKPVAPEDWVRGRAAAGRALEAE